MDKKTLNTCLENLKKYLENRTEEEIEEDRKFLCGDDEIIPKGWISIEDHLPSFIVRDIEQGYSIYEVKNNDGEIGTTTVTDSRMWYYRAKEIGVTHWLNK
jgi:hypothetical protein